MTVFWFDPTQDPRWNVFVNRHPGASVFHTHGWIKALCRTYGYEAAALTTSAPEQEITNGIPFCRVNSWLTGRRLVSLPFSDHCEPLFDRPEDRLILLGGLRQSLEQQHVSTIELRPLAVDCASITVPSPNISRLKAFFSPA